jgi:biopolymer transport protein ExbD
MEISTPQAKRSLISLTPLIDVVFILLIFFMLASSFLEWQYIQLSVAASDTTTDTDIKHSVIVVNINHHYTLNEKKSSLALIKTHLQRQITLNNSHSVFVKPANELPLQQLVRFLEAIESIQGINISLVSESEEHRNTSHGY